MNPIVPLVLVGLAGLMLMLDKSKGKANGDAKEISDTDPDRSGGSDRSELHSGAEKPNGRGAVTDEHSKGDSNGGNRARNAVGREQHPATRAGQTEGVTDAEIDTQNGGVDTGDGLGSELSGGDESPGAEADSGIGDSDGQQSPG